MQPPLEAQLIDVADEIAYNCADLDDGYEAKLLTVAQIRKRLPLFDRLIRPFERAHPDALEKLKFNEALKRMMDYFVTDLIETTRRRLRRAGVKSVEAVRVRTSRLAGLSPAASREDRRLKEFLFQNLYSHPSIRAERKKITDSISGLFLYFVAHPRSLPSSYQKKTPGEPLHRVVCDYIAGMTDNYLLDQYRRYVGE